MSTPTKAAQPKRELFDAWNSSSTGHQVSPSLLAGSTAWRESRSLKLGVQFGAGGSGGKRVSDSVGAGSENFGRDGRKANGSWMAGAAGLRERGQKSIQEAMKAGIKKKVDGHDKLFKGKREKAKVDVLERLSATGTGKELDDTPPPGGQSRNDEDDDDRSLGRCKKMFDGLCFYINGSTAPAVSDHKLKHLLCERGGRISIALRRRGITHVILGKTNSSGGCGGGLAAMKIQKEVSRVGGKGLKFVGVEWWVHGFPFIVSFAGNCMIVRSN